MPSRKRARYVVVGGGVSGIAAAHYLMRAGHDVELVERERSLGGRIDAREMRGRPIELGGKNVGRGYRLFREFTAAMGHHPYEHIGVSTARASDREWRTIDSSRRWRSFVRQLSRRSLRDLGRLAAMVIRIKVDEREGYLGGAWFRRLADETDDATAASYFTRPFCDDALRPIGLLMNGAEPDELHLGNLGTNIRMALDDYDQLTLGMGRLLDQFAVRSRARLGVSARELVVRGGEVLGVRVEDRAGAREELMADAVILATPAFVTASLVAPHAAALAAELREIRYFPTAVVVADYERDVFTPDLRALRFGEGEPLSNARAYGKGALGLVRYTFSGRAARPLLDGPLDPERLLDLAEASLGRHLAVSRALRRGFVGPERASFLAAYSAHHASRLDRIAAAGRALPGLRLTGDYLRGASLEACFRASRDCVEELVSGESAGRREDRMRRRAGKGGADVRPVG